MLQYQVIPVTAFQQNCSLLWCDQSRDAVLVDPGGDTNLLLAAVDDNKVNLKKIYLTHGHLDHVGATAELKKRLKLPVIGPHRDDQFLLDAIAMQCEMFGFPLVDGFLPDQWLVEGDTLSVGDEKLQVIHTPGHTPGHIVLQHLNQKILWVGDVIFHRSIGRTDLPGGNHAQLLSSIKNKLLTLDDDYRFIPGHGPESSIGEEKRSNPFLAE